MTSLHLPRPTGSKTQTRSQVRKPSQPGSLPLGLPCTPLLQSTCRVYGPRPSRQTNGARRSLDQARLPSANQPKSYRVFVSTVRNESTEIGHTLDVQAGEYPFGVVNGFPLELERGEQGKNILIGEPSPNARDLYSLGEDSLAYCRAWGRFC